MDVTPLALVGCTPHDIDRYSNWLEARLTDLSPLLVKNPVWSDATMHEVFGHPWLSQTYASLPLGTAVAVLTNEDERVRAVVKLNRFIDAYLVVGRFIDPAVYCTPSSVARRLSIPRAMSAVR